MLCPSIRNFNTQFCSLDIFFISPSLQDKYPHPYLILLLEAIALSAFHLSDVLEEVGHADGRLELARLVGHLHRLTAPVRVRLDGQGRLGHLTVAAFCRRETQEDDTQEASKTQRAKEGC